MSIRHKSKGDKAVQQFLAAAAAAFGLSHLHDREEMQIIRQVQLVGRTNIKHMALFSLATHSHPK